jgi:hypothetical protein
LEIVPILLEFLPMTISGITFRRNILCRREESLPSGAAARPPITSRRRDDDRGAGLRAQPAIAMWRARIEVHRVASVQRMVFSANLHD